ncbi:MAG TPA: prenyltransferase/squalene oxidase repeat-containing protein [Solirubrobacteraceae bacterium]|nr:prenyltransferase/squalene oxidase repeat-containing protein [Solirubrobacteraceae bacterium]
MSWPVSAFVVVALVLAVGWLAYERARPPARMVALVATLAALAALGRDAFVALPDVKPITAMTFVVGYALGPLPGFSVGALGMLASNMLLGQGPYTPWQMAAWGAVGLVGAAVGRVSSRSLRRAGIAIACAVCALAAKEVMNVYTWTVGASHTPAALLAASATALPFDITDAVASLLFGLAFGPELARVLARVQLRMHVTWERPAERPAAPRDLPAGAGATRALGASPANGSGRQQEIWRLPLMVLCAAAVAWSALGAAPAERANAARYDGPAAAAPPASARATAVGPSREISYLVGSQNSDGGFGAARGQASSELYTAWAAMALAASGRSPVGVRQGGRSPLDYMEAQVHTLSGVGDVERTILAAHACGASAYSFGGYDLPAELLRGRSRDNSFGDQVNLTAFAVIALTAAGHSPRYGAVREASGWLERQQSSDGGFGFARRGAPSDVDDTGAVLQALFDAGAHNRRALSAAVNYLGRAQNLDGGLPQKPGGQSNSQSTAWAAQGLLAAGRDPALVRRRGSRSPIEYLESLAAPDGSIRYSRTSAQTPVWVTAQALIALQRRVLPV